MAYAQPTPLRWLAAVAIAACLLGAGVSALVSRWDLASVSHTAALQAARQVSGSDANASSYGVVNMSMMGGPGFSMMGMMMGMNGGQGTMMSTGKSSTMGSMSSMTIGAMMGERSGMHAGDAMMGGGSMMGEGMSGAH